VLFICLPALPVLLSCLVFHEFLAAFDHCYWCEILSATELLIKCLLSSVRLDLVTKTTLNVTAFMSKIDRHETKMDYGNTYRIFFFFTHSCELLQNLIPHHPYRKSGYLRLANF